MPVIKSAKKKLRQDKRKTAQNHIIETHVKLLIKKAKTKKSKEAIRLAVQATDKATKRNIFHDNKAARIKSSLAKLMMVSATKTRKTKQQI
jgi:small subunit ribosomal protein S20